jgi:predicted nuclease of predicted toxin-antitoxin system
MIRFLLDAQFPPGLAERLTAHGYPAEHVNRVHLGTAGDEAIWRHAQRIGATLVTKDEDFAALASRDPNGPQVVWTRIGNISNDALWRALEPLLEEIVQSLDAGERIVEVV